MATKAQLGRGTHQNLVHASYAEAAQYTGPQGEITLVRNAAGDITEARLHNGFRLGGFVLIAAPADTVAGFLPNAKVVPLMEVVVADPATPFAFEHGLGYNPIVQVSDGTVPVVTHIDANNVELKFAAAGTYEINLR